MKKIAHTKRLLIKLTDSANELYLSTVLSKLKRIGIVKRAYLQLSMLLVTFFFFSNMYDERIDQIPLYRNLFKEIK